MEFKIDPTELFQHLPRAPIVEAVIHWQARAGNVPEQSKLLTALIEKLPEYPEPQPQHEFQVGGEFGPEGTAIQQRSVWLGFRFQSRDKRYVAQFNRNGLVFSRLEPYEDWEHFEAEALRLWQVYRELLELHEIQRLGVRFINLVSFKRMDELSELLVSPPSAPPKMDLPLIEFMHQSRFDLPGYGYKLNVIQTIQPPAPPERENFGLILDLDVFTTQTPAPADEEQLKAQLGEMRWIKNKAFFSFLTQATIDRYKE
jgi:uncharacterized protein (TIGR04255 family)